MGSFFGLSAEFPMDQLLTRSTESNKILLVSTGVREALLAAAAGDEFKAISGGCRVLGRSNFNKTNRECDFRLVQATIHHENSESVSEFTILLFMHSRMHKCLGELILPDYLYIHHDCLLIGHTVLAPKGLG